MGLAEEFGPARVRDTPMSEQPILGAAIGAAMTGLRPIAEIMFSDFFAVCSGSDRQRDRRKAATCPTGRLRSRWSSAAATGRRALRRAALQSWRTGPWPCPGGQGRGAVHAADVIGLLAAACAIQTRCHFFEASRCTEPGRGRRRRDRRPGWVRRRWSGRAPTPRSWRWARWSRGRGGRRTLAGQHGHPL